MEAQLGNCVSLIGKSIEVVADSSDLMIPTDFGDRQILSFSVGPNPTVGPFTVDFELDMDKPYTIQLYRLDGTTVETRNESGIGTLSELFDASAQANGPYILTLRSDGEVKWKTLIIEKP